MALVLNNLVDLLDVHADLKIDRIHLTPATSSSCRGRFLLGHHRNFWISGLVIQSPNLNIADGSDPTPVSSTITHVDSLLSTFSGKLPYKVNPPLPSAR